MNQDQLPQVSKKDKKLFSKAIRVPEGMTEEDTDLFFAYIASGKANDEAELYSILPEKLMKYWDVDYSGLALDFKEELGEKTDQTIVQVGCGRGDLLIALAKLGYTNLYGIDNSPAQAKGTEEKLSGENISAVKMIQAFGQDYDYSQLGKTIDAVILHNFWSVIDQEASVKLVEKLNACMAEGSRLYIGPFRQQKSSTWKFMRAMRRLKKIESRFGIKIFYNVNVDFAEYGFKTDVLFFKNEDYHYYRQTRTG